MKFPFSKLALKWCQGCGLEIGAAAHNPFGLNTKNVGLPEEADNKFYADAQINLCGEAAKIDFYMDGDQLLFPDNSWDFVVSSHTIEHSPNPIKAIKGWMRVVRPGGVVFITCPKRDAWPPDRDRPLTTIEHLAMDYELGIDVDTHPLKGDECGRRGHYHVFTLERFCEMLKWMEDAFNDTSFRPVEVLETDDKVGNGFTVVLQKSS